MRHHVRWSRVDRTLALLGVVGVGMFVLSGVAAASFRDGGRHAAGQLAGVGFWVALVVMIVLGIRHPELNRGFRIGSSRPTLVIGPVASDGTAVITRRPDGLRLHADSWSAVYAACDLWNVSRNRLEFADADTKRQIRDVWKNE